MSAQDLEKWAGRPKPGMPLFEGPAAVREVFILSHGIDWTASYIDPAVWIEQTRTLISMSNVAFDRITQQAKWACQSQGITVRGPSDRPSQRMAAE